MFEDLISANRDYSKEFTLGGVPPRASRGFALVTCMDSRIEPLVMLGLRPGDAKILRNAGGRVTPDVLRSLVLAVAYLGVAEIAVMHHTGCAMVREEQELRSGLADERRGFADDWPLYAMPDPDAALAADVEAVRTCPVLPPEVRVEGWRYDVETGLVDRVIRSDAAGLADRIARHDG